MRPFSLFRLQRSLLLGIALILGIFQTGWGQPSPKDGTDSLDPALRSIVRLILDQPDEEEVVTRAIQWARRQGKLQQLLETVLSEARNNSSDALFHFCAQFALKSEEPLRAISILEEGCATPDSLHCPRTLGRLWLEGGWVEAARSIRKEYGVDPIADFLLRLKAGEKMAAESLPAMAPKDRDFLIRVFSRLNLCQEGADFFESSGDLQAALSILIRCGDLPGIERLLALHTDLDQNTSPNEVFPLARLRGKLPRDQFVPRKLKSLWDSSMGFGEPESLSIGNNMRLASLFQSLNLACTNGESLLARKIWISIESLLPPMTPYPAMNPRWREVLGPALASWADPSHVAQQMCDIRDPEAASVCRRAILYTNPGSLTEARLWFHAGRLSNSLPEVERAIRIQPEESYCRPLAIPGISVTTTLPMAEVPIPEPEPFSILNPEDSVIGEVTGLPLRIPGQDRSQEEWFLADWIFDESGQERLQTEPTNFRREPSGSPLRIQLTDTNRNPLKIIGSAQRWSIFRSDKEMRILHATNGESLFGKDGLPRLDLLRTIIDPTPQALQVRVDWNQWPASVANFAKACGQYLRDSEWQNQVRLHCDSSQLTVTLGPITGTFLKDRPSDQNSFNPAQLPRLSSRPRQAPSQPFANPLQFDGSATLERESKQEASNRHISSPTPILLPPEEELLSTTGTGDRLAITRSGKIGWIPKGSLIAQSWLPLLTPPFPGRVGYPPLPLDVYPADSRWADSVTPRVRETRGPNGSIFLVVSEPLLRFDSQGASPVSTPDQFPGHCVSAQLLTDTGKTPRSSSDPLFLWFIDSSRQFLYGPGFQQSLPVEGAYSLHGHPLGPLVLGQHQGKSWLAQWREQSWNFVPLPPLPGERDRPHLRAAAIEVSGSQILLVADRLWILNLEGPPTALIPQNAPGAYRAVHWVQPPPRISDQSVAIDRPWGVEQIWRFSDG